MPRNKKPTNQNDTDRNTKIQIENSVFESIPIFEERRKKGRMIKEQTRITVCIQETKITVKTIL